MQAVQHARDNPSPDLADRSVHGGKTSQKKKLAFFDLAKTAAADSGKNFDSTFHRSTTTVSRSKMLKDVSHHNTASNAIPKVRAEVRYERRALDV